MIRVTFFTRPECTLCKGAWFALQRVIDSLPASESVEVERVDISAVGNERWLDAYSDQIPVVHLDGQEVMRHRVDAGSLRRQLREVIEPRPKRLGNDTKKRKNEIGDGLEDGLDDAGHDEVV